mmetsp:Transcript_7983/g.17403  ORF Transcript_7983/g.17403 Transcript_7983/m.17403 type:complete len:206 (-) Transcript_7983:127-744(-)
MPHGKETPAGLTAGGAPAGHRTQQCPWGHAGQTSPGYPHPRVPSASSQYSSRPMGSDPCGPLNLTSSAQTVPRTSPPWGRLRGTARGLVRGQLVGRTTRIAQRPPLVKTGIPHCAPGLGVPRRCPAHQAAALVPWDRLLRHFRSAQNALQTPCAPGSACGQPGKHSCTATPRSAQYPCSGTGASAPASPALSPLPLFEGLTPPPI